MFNGEVPVRATAVLPWKRTLFALVGFGMATLAMEFLSDPSRSVIGWPTTLVWLLVALSSAGLAASAIGDERARVEVLGGAGGWSAADALWGTAFAAVMGGVIAYALTLALATMLPGVDSVVEGRLDRVESFQFRRRCPALVVVSVNSSGDWFRYCLRKNSRLLSAVDSSIGEMVLIDIRHTVLGVVVLDVRGAQQL